MKQNREPVNQTYSYLALRKAVGWIGILLPFVLLAGVLLIFKQDKIPANISQYYYTGMRDVFVGSMCAIALFLFYYRGYTKWDNIAGNIAGFLALGIAFFPTDKSKPYDLSSKIHFICAALFFIVLSIFSFFLFTRKKPNPTKRKLARNRIYIICGSVMMVCMLLILIFFIFFDNENTDTTFVYWTETIALVAFGISWLTKGGTLYPDKIQKLT